MKAQVLRRAAHWRDERRDPLHKRKVTRVISDHISWRDPRGTWRGSAPGIGAQPGPPPDWGSGAFEFDRASLSAPLQFFARDAMDVGNRAMWGVRLSERPGLWLNVKAADVAAGVDVRAVGSRTVDWPGLWADATLRVTHGRHKVKSDVVLTGPGHPEQFVSTVKMHPSMSLAERDGGIDVLDGDGAEVMRMPPPYGYIEGSAFEEPVVACTLRLGGLRKGNREVVLTPSQDDLARVGYSRRIVLDPTTTIPGTAIDDTQLFDGTISDRHRNYGGYTYVFVGGYVPSAVKYFTGLFRLDETLIPSGSITLFDFIVSRASHSNSSVGDTMDINTVASGRPWGEGTYAGTQQAGSADALDYADGTGAWTDVNAAHIGDDIDSADATTYSYGPYTTGADVETTITLPTTWATQWRDATKDNEGFRMFSRTVPGSPGYLDYLFAIRSTESAFTAPVFEITYDVSSLPAGIFVVLGGQIIR